MSVTEAIDTIAVEVATLEALRKTDPATFRPVKAPSKGGHPGKKVMGGNGARLDDVASRLEGFAARLRAIEVR